MKTKIQKLAKIVFHSELKTVVLEIRLLEDMVIAEIKIIAIEITEIQ